MWNEIVRINIVLLVIMSSLCSRIPLKSTRLSETNLELTLLSALLQPSYDFHYSWANRWKTCLATWPMRWFQWQWRRVWLFQAVCLANWIISILRCPNSAPWWYATLITYNTVTVHCVQWNIDHAVVFGTWLWNIGIISTPTLWNSLPVSVKSEGNIVAFRRRLKPISLKCNAVYPP